MSSLIRSGGGDLDPLFIGMGGRIGQIWFSPVAVRFEGNW